MKKILPSFLIIVVIILLVLFHFSKYATEEEQHKDFAGEIVEKASCIHLADQFLVGVWSQPIGGHEPNIYEMSLNQDNTFSLRIVNIETKSVITEDTGIWLFDKEKIGLMLRFDNSQYWNEIVAKGEVILEEPPVGHGFLDYSQDKNSITFKVGYLQNLIDIGCEENRYAIDIMQNYLYKQLG